jgi:hypothetical protein
MQKLPPAALVPQNETIFGCALARDSTTSVTCVEWLTTAPARFVDVPVTVSVYDCPPSAPAEMLRAPHPTAPTSNAKTVHIATDRCNPRLRLPLSSQGKTKHANTSPRYRCPAGPRDTVAFVCTLIITVADLMLFHPAPIHARSTHKR